MDAAATPGRQPGADPSGAATPDDGGAPTRLTGAEAWKAHATLVAGLALCVAALWFELGRALGGNGLSWAYVFEWPLFAAFAIYMWWNVLNGDRAVRRRRSAKTEAKVDPKYAGMLEAWQSHQRELQAAQAEADGATGPGRQTEDGSVGHTGPV